LISERVTGRARAAEKMSRAVAAPAVRIECFVVIGASMQVVA
jgi:hypothetical protein